MPYHFQSIVIKVLLSLFASAAFLKIAFRFFDYLNAYSLKFFACFALEIFHFIPTFEKRKEIYMHGIFYSDQKQFKCDHFWLNSGGFKLLTDFPLLLMLWKNCHLCRHFRLYSFIGRFFTAFALSGTILC